MRDELLAYYERELSFLRQMGAEFAEKYPKIASRLQLEADRSEDPHVERMIEAFAFLAGRVRLKIDDEFPEITESLLNVLYPNLLAPVPPMSIVQFVVDPDQVNLQTGHVVPRGSMLYSRSVEGTACRFRTAYPVTIWPVELGGAGFQMSAPSDSPLATAGARTVLKLELKTMGGIPFHEIRGKTDDGERPIDRLRFYLMNEGKVVYGLYELLLNNVIGVELRPGGGRRGGPPPVLLPPDVLRPVGFERDEALLPYSDRSFQGYRLLQEFFTFPEKFLFVDLCGLERLARPGYEEAVEVWIHFDKEFPLERQVTAPTFRLNCSPIVNLFKQVAEPIRLTHLQNEYRVVADVRRQSATEIYSIESVVSVSPNLEVTTAYQPFYSFKHSVDRERQQTFWYASRRPSQRKDDEGTELYLTLVDLGFNPSVPDVETLTVEAVCTNRDLPSRLPFGNPEGDFQLEGAGVFTSIRCLRKPTGSLRAPLRRGTQWRLISHLSLNYLSLVEGSDGPEALQEVLKLYDFADSSVTRQMIAGIARVAARRVLRPVGSVPVTYVRGLEVSVEFDEARYIGSGVFLFASVLERFLGLYASINSFSQLVASVRQREGVLKRWLPRSGEQIVL